MLGHPGERQRDRAGCVVSPFLNRWRVSELRRNYLGKWESRLVLAWHIVWIPPFLLVAIILLIISFIGWGSARTAAVFFEIFDE